MRKWVVSLAAALVLMGCNGATENEVDVEDETPDVEENQGADTEDNNETDIETEDENDLEERGNDTDLDADVNESETMTFVPQDADIASGLTIENDEVLSTLNELVETSDIDQVGIPDDVTVQFTGLYLEDAEQEVLMPIFLISNRTDQTFTNIDITLTFGLNDGELLFDQTGFTLADDDFGILEPNTAKPVYLNTDFSNLELVERLSQTRDEMISIDSFDAETLEDQANTGRNTMNTGNPSSVNLEFVPTASQINDDVSIDNDLVLSQVQELIDGSPEVGLEGDVVIHWTGIYEMSTTDDESQAIFIIVNRTGEAMKNIELGIKFTDSNDNIILQDERFTFTEEDFGVFENQTIKPLYLEIPKDKEQYMPGVQDVNQAFYSFEYFDAESVN